MKKLMKSGRGRLLLGVIVLALVIAVNVILGGCPLKKDVTSAQIMTPSAEAVSYAGSIDQPVSICYAASDNVYDVWVEEYLKAFSEKNDNLTYERIDPASPAADRLTRMLGGLMPADGSVALVSGERYAVIGSSELYRYEFDQMAYNYYGTMNYTSMEFAVESAVCDAMAYLFKEDMPVLYVAAGHNELPVDTMLLTVCRENNIRLKNIDDLSVVPDDAAAIIINNPAKSYRAEEADALKAYLAQGGDAVVISDYNADLTYLADIARDYGMEILGGVVLDNDSRHVYSPDYKYYLIPEIADEETSLALAQAGEGVILPLSGALTRSTVRRAGLNARIILTSSDKAYLKTDVAGMKTIEQEDGDPSGRFILGMSAVEGDTHLTWITSAGFCCTAGYQMSGGGNGTLLKGMLSEMFEIPAKDEALPGVNIMSEAVVVPEIPALIAVIALPLILLLIGLAVNAGRKKAMN